MTERLLGLAVACVALMAGTARAEAPKLESTPVAITWKDGSARVGNVATLRLTVAKDGDRLFTFTFDGGPMCGTIAAKNATAYLQCGRTENRFYSLTQAPGGEPEVELTEQKGR